MSIYTVDQALGWRLTKAPVYPSDFQLNVRSGRKERNDPFWESPRMQLSPMDIGFTERDANLAGAVDPLVPGVPNPALLSQTWTTNNPGVSNDDQITLPLISTGTYDFLIDWGDDSTDTITAFNDAAVTHTYATEGTFQIKMSGVVKGWQFDGGGDGDKIISIENWSTLEITTNGAFSGCSNLTSTATDAPIISATDLSDTFKDCTAFNADIDGWDVSSVVDFSDMFRSATIFNQSINNWDMSSATDIGAMFLFASAYNQPMDLWNVSNVISMGSTFLGALVFNQSIDSWDTSSVTSMSNMFLNANSFNQDLNSWNVSNVTGMTSMFQNCLAFNGDISAWNVSSVTQMSSIFRNAEVFNVDISAWNVSLVTNMGNAFNEASVFNQNIGAWNVSSVTSMIDLFRGTLVFNQNIGAWNVSSVTSMVRMFQGADSFDQDLGLWNVSSVTDATDMFSGITLSTANYNSLIIGWALLPLQSGVIFDGGNSQYTISIAQASRDVLTDPPNSWIITDGGGI